MPDFALKAYNGAILAITDRDKLVLGTCMLGEAYGEVKSASLTRTGAEEELTGCLGEIIAFLVKNPGFELKMECRFDSDVDPPEILDAITFPLAAVTGHVKPGSEITWEEGGVRMLSFTAAAWDSMQGEDVARFYWDKTEDELVDLDAAP